MFESIGNFFKKIVKAENKEIGSKDDAKERLHLVLMQDRANVSADFLELMKQEIIDVIKKYIVVDEGAIDVRLTNKQNEDGTNGAPALYANIPIINIKNDMKAEKIKEFDGVNFNKKLEEAEEENKQQEKVEATISEMIDGIEDNNQTKDESSQNEESTESKEKAIMKEEQQVITEEDDESDDDVTFDDLLKAAEAADNEKENKGK